MGKCYKKVDLNCHTQLSTGANSVKDSAHIIKGGLAKKRKANHAVRNINTTV